MYSVDRRSFKTDFSIAFDWLLSLSHPLQESQEPSEIARKTWQEQDADFPYNNVMYSQLHTNKPTAFNSFTTKHYCLRYKFRNLSGTSLTKWHLRQTVPTCTANKEVQHTKI
jgi:hypothetical protein